MPIATQCHAVYMQLHHVTHLSNWRRREGLSQSSCLTRVGALSPSAQRSYGSARGLALLWHWDFYDLRWAMQVQLGNGSSSSWSTSLTWLPLFLEAQPLEEVLSRCRQGSTQVATSVCVGRFINFCGIQHSSICKSWLIMINDEQQCVDECTNMCKPFADARNPISIPKIITSPHFATSIATLQLPGKPKLGIYNCRALLRAVLRWLRWKAPSLRGVAVLFRCSGLHMELRKVSWVCPAPYRGRAFHILPISQSFIICKAICIEHVREHSEHCIEYVLNSYKFI